MIPWPWLFAVFVVGLFLGSYLMLVLMCVLAMSGRCSDAEEAG